MSRPHKTFAALRNLRAWRDHVADSCDHRTDSGDKFAASRTAQCARSIGFLLGT
jgi:hypothetical protein